MFSITALVVTAALGAHAHALEDPQNRRDWKQIRNNRNNDVQIFEPIPLYNNFRKTQPLGQYRKLYRSEAASDACLAKCSDDSNSTACVRERKPTKTRRRRAYTTFFHWDYADQRRWFRWIHPMKWENECLAGSTGPTQWGESPINIDPSSAEPIKVGFQPDDDAYIDLSREWKDRRPFLFVGNNGHSVQLTVCGNNVYDCKARARFGDWPCKMRGANCSNDEYILAQLHFHWGEDSTKGSEHTVCGSPRPAEMHMVFLNTRWGDPEFPVPWDLDNPGRGVRLLVLGTFIESNGDGPDNPAFSSIIDSVEFPQPRKDMVSFRDRGVAYWANTSGPSQGPIDLIDLLPANFSDQFYSYPGSLTTPPCSQFVSWFVFENAVQWSEKQLNQLRSATTYYHFPHAHPHYYSVILFACVMLILGTLTKQFLERYAPTVPYTMLCMLWGFVINFLASTNNDGQLNPMQQSIRMWSNIDGHLALYVFLPALIFGDVMKINIHRFLQTFKQACFLAGPCVVLSTYLTAFVVNRVLPYGWSWTFSLAMGAILGATDPIAVLALMRNLKAPKALTMQVTGESLLNDGTSVILFTIFFDMSRERRGQYASVVRLIRIMTRYLVFSPFLGVVVGTVAVYWMMRSSHRYSKDGSLVQLCVTLIAAYLGFFLSENTKIGQASGVLTTVAAGVVLAWRAWPMIISKEAMENVWGAMEHILNTLIFSLVGVQMSRGKLSHNVNWRELYWCIVLYVAIFAIRAAVVFISVPIINLLGPNKVSAKESTFMVLAGLRGAVSLALAIFVKQKRSNTQRTWPDDDDHDAERALFLVGGVAFLTLLINAPIAHPLLARFNLIAGSDESRKPVVDCARRRIIEAAVDAYKTTCLKLNHDAKNVTTLCRNLSTIKNATPVADAAWERKEKAAAEGIVVAATPPKELDVEVGFEVGHLEAIRDKLSQLPHEERLAALRDTFLSIVNAQYWDMIDNGELPKAAKATILLLRSIDIAKDELKVELHDFRVVERLISEINVPTKHERTFNAINQYTPTWFTVSSELYYKLSYECHEVIYYVLRAYCIAHGTAQHIFVEANNGMNAQPARPEELVVLLESARLVNLARLRLGDVSPKLKSIVKSKIVAERVIEAQRNAVYKLRDQGVLEEVDADGLEREIDEDERGIILARKAQTQAIAKYAVLKDLPIVARSAEWDLHFRYRANSTGEFTKEGDDSDGAQSEASNSVRLKRKNSSHDNLLQSIEYVEAHVVSSMRSQDRTNFMSTEDELKHSDERYGSRRFLT